MGMVISGRELTQREFGMNGGLLVSEAPRRNLQSLCVSGSRVNSDTGPVSRLSRRATRDRMAPNRCKSLIAQPCHRAGELTT
jgi:hypothetical protein